MMGRRDDAGTKAYAENDDGDCVLNRFRMQ